MGTQQVLRASSSSSSSASKLYLKLGLVEQIKQAVPSASGGGTPQVLSILSSVLERTLQRSVRESAEGDSVITAFHGCKPPALAVRPYIERIYKYSGCSPSCFVVAYIYLDRFLKHKGRRLTSLNVHRLLITSVMLAAKFLDDEYYDNAYFARVGGVSTAEMNNLEKEFLFAIDFRLHVPVEIFDKYCQWLEREAAAICQTEPPSRLCKPKEGFSSRVEAKNAPAIVGYTL